jgi:hypothetical protein
MEIQRSNPALDIRIARSLLLRIEWFMITKDYCCREAINTGGVRSLTVKCVLCEHDIDTFSLRQRTTRKQTNSPTITGHESLLIPEFVCVFVISACRCGSVGDLE